MQLALFCKLMLDTDGADSLWYLLMVLLSFFLFFFFFNNRILMQLVLTASVASQCCLFCLLFGENCEDCSGRLVLLFIGVVSMQAISDSLWHLLQSFV